MAAAAGLVDLRADAVELILGVERAAVHRRGRLLGRLLRRGEHELDGVEQAEPGRVQRVVLRQHGHLVDVADEELASLDRGQRLAEGLRHRRLEHALLHAGAHVAEDDLGEVRRLALVRAPREKHADDFLLVFPGAGGGEVVEGFGEILQRQRRGGVVLGGLRPQLRQRVADFAASRHLFPEAVRIDVQDGSENHVADEPAADVEHALVGRGKRAAAGVADGEPQVALVERPEILRQGRLLLELLRRRRRGVVDRGELSERGGHAPILGAHRPSPTRAIVAGKLGEVCPSVDYLNRSSFRDFTIARFNSRSSIAPSCR